MKNSKIFKSLMFAITIIAMNITAFTFNTVLAISFSVFLGINPVVPIIAWNILAIRLGNPLNMPAQAYLRTGVQKELWLPILMEDFYAEAGWLKKAQDMSALVEYNTLNLAEAGVLPTVYINNNTFPLTLAQRADTPIAISLDTLSTQPTIVRRVEQMESSYAKMQSVTNGHKTALRLKSYERAAHAYAPTANTAKTPVLVATGGDDGTGRKRLTLADLAKAQRLIEEIDGIDANISKTLVLCSKHKEDLILEDKGLFKQFANLQKGQILPLFNFETFVYNTGAVYNTSIGAKKAFGAAATPATDSKATSFFFVDNEVMRADGDYEMFATLNSSTEQGDSISFLKRFIALPFRNKGIGALYSGAV